MSILSFTKKSLVFSEDFSMPRSASVGTLRTTETVTEYSPTGMFKERMPLPISFCWIMRFCALSMMVRLYCPPKGNSRVNFVWKFIMRLPSSKKPLGITSISGTTGAGRPASQTWYPARPSRDAMNRTIFMDALRFAFFFAAPRYRSICVTCSARDNLCSGSVSSVEHKPQRIWILPSLMRKHPECFSISGKRKEPRKLR